MRRLAPLLFVLISAIAPPVAALGPGTFLQPAESQRQLVLQETGGRTWIRSAGGRTDTVRLRSGEKVTSVVELPAGWAVAGTREQPEGRRLLVIAGGARGQRHLGEPPERQGRHRLSPALLTDSTGVAGMAWLEGDGPKSLGVRAARWTDQGWETPEVVAPPGPGSQTGLSAVRLGDGRWLLVWSAFDGQDDEIVWSLGDHRGWTTPRRLTAGNSVPDILPTLIAAPGGALLAWSRFDGGQYRVMLSRFQGGRWQKAAIAGPRGSVRPRLLNRRGRLLLIFREPGLSRWSLLNLDREGRETRRVSLAIDETGEPAILEASAAGARLVEPDEGREILVRWGTDR